MGARWIAGALLACWVVTQAEAQDAAAPRLEVHQDNGRMVIVILDPGEQRLLVYGHSRGGGLELESVRAYGYDLPFLEWSARGKQKPSVKDQRRAVKQAEPERRPSLVVLVEALLEVRGLRERKAQLPPGQPEPEVQRMPLSQRLQKLERDSLELRLKLSDASADPDAFRAKLLETIRTRAKGVQQRIAARERLRQSLPPDHGGRARLEGALDALRGELDQLQALEQAEAKE